MVQCDDRVMRSLGDKGSGVEWGPGIRCRNWEATPSDFFLKPCFQHVCVHMCAHAHTHTPMPITWGGKGPVELAVGEVVASLWALGRSWELLGQ